MPRFVAVFNFAVYFALLRLVSANSKAVTEICSSYIPKDYKMFESPNKDKPVKIYIRFDILDIGEIEEGHMDFLFHVFFTAIWKDPRLTITEPMENNTTPIFLPKECLPYLWQPDIFFETAKTAETFKTSMPVIILKVYSDSKISVTTRYLFRSSCRMRFQNYPFDNQICEFYIALIPPDAVTVLCWADDKDSPLPSPVVTLLRQIEPLQYYLGTIKTHKFVDILPDANYTSLITELTLHRRLLGSVINIYIPSTLIVSMSFIGFWLGVEAVPARTALSVTSLLTLCTQAQRYQTELPPVNYVKAMDIWLFVCIFLVFSTLIEFAVAHNISHAKRRKRTEEINQRSMQSNITEISQSSSSQGTLFGRARKHSVETSRRTSSHSSLNLKTNFWKTCEPLWTKWKNKSVDEICQWLYPLSFVSFAVFYFVYYLRIYHSKL